MIKLICRGGFHPTARLIGYVKVGFITMDLVGENLE